MRSYLIGVLVTACVCSLVFAGDLTTVKPGNNVFKMTTTGERTGLCGCTKEFPVSDKSPSLSAEGTDMYCCSPECHDHASKATKEESTAMMATWKKAWDLKVPDLWANAKEVEDKEGTKMATCACGKKFTVETKTPVILENGVALYCCSDACHTQLTKMSALDRYKAELALIKAAPAVKQESKGD
ncbi:hypothetical protein HZB60_06770 [candidate division KSB1 bacterium]|nr:hypothetical protein [candidate division KSB1 bacterium]